LFNASGLAKATLFDLEKKVGYLGGDIPKLRDGTANTAFAHHQKKTYCMYESDLPYNIRVDRDEKNFDIKSIGFDDFGGQLTHNVSAHPKVDRKTGELLCFGYGVDDKTGEGIVNYSLFNKDRKLINTRVITITNPRMVHDFIITENYFIIPDSPMEMRPDLTVKEGKFIF
jgi:carotenoid cleavage dioxygenase-like enzyme